MATTATALVVNDDAAQLRLISRVLERDGFHAVSSLSAEEALRHLSQSGAVDVIVTDLYMPGIDGWRFCRLLRSSAYAAFNGIPIIVVSATFTGAEAEELTAQLGADAFLPVPFEPAMLRQLARALLAHTQSKTLTRVLVVAPESSETQALIDAFSAGGYQVAHEVSAAAAERRLRQRAPQIVVIDYDPADRSAVALLEKTSQPGNSMVTLVLLAQATAELALEVIRKGADCYVPKPVLAEYMLHLCEASARRRALLRVEELLEIRTRSLRESERRYRDLFENAGDGIAIYALDGNVLNVNRAFEELLGLSRERLVGRHYRHFFAAARFDAAAAQQQKAQAQNDPSWRYESELSGPSAPPPVEVHCRFLRDDNGQPAMVMALYRDIRDRKAVERQRAEFAAMLAHDIRSPIALILGCAELLLDDAGRPLDPDTVQKCHQRIRDDARVLDSLVSNYLDLSRIDAAQINLSMERMDLRGALERIVECYQCEAQPRAIRLEFTADEAALIDGDPLALDRVFANLLQNAFKATPDGGAIGVTLGHRGSDAVVEVRDNGRGIEAEDLPVLFDKFSRVETGERREGLGLGLYIVSQLVAAHGGRVEVESELGKGSCFSVFLPLPDDK
jgi:PAS domain S-box-containing protein